MNTSTEKDRTNSSAFRAKNPATEEVAATQVPGDQIASGNLDKIRDILFGAQTRDYERKFAVLEERLVKESADLRNDLKRRFEDRKSVV